MTSDEARQVKLLLLDKDGTLTAPKSGKEFVQSPEDQKLLPGVADAIAAYAADGWMMVIVSNQVGVEAGHKTLESAIAEMRYCLKLLPQIKNAYFCPDFAGDQCWVCSNNPYAVDATNLSNFRHEFDSFRKPNAGLMHMAIEERNQDIDCLLMVGDRDKDRNAAVNAGIPFMSAEEWRTNPVLGVKV